MPCILPCHLTRSAYPFQLSDEEWKKRLSAEEFRVLRQGGTEAPGKGQYCKSYFCALDDLWCERANETAADNCTAASGLPALPPAPSASRPPAAPTPPTAPLGGLIP